MKGKSLIQIGLLLLAASAFGRAQSGGPPVLPPEIAAVLEDASKIAIVDPDGNPLWTREAGTPLASLDLPEGAVLVVYDAEGNPRLVLPLTLGPNGKPLLELPDGSLLPPGALLREKRPQPRAPDHPHVTPPAGPQRHPANHRHAHGPKGHR